MANFLEMCGKEVVERQSELIKHVGLPTAIPQMKFTDLWRAMQHDKKVLKGQIHCVVPQGIGDVRVIPLVRQSIRRWYSGRHLAGKKSPKIVGKASPHLRPSRKK